MDEGGLLTQTGSLYENCARRTWREGSFTEDPEEYVKESSGNWHLSPLWSCWGNIEGTLLYQRL
jgi:hypothetical protein